MDGAGTRRQSYLTVDSLQAAALQVSVGGSAGRPWRRSHV